MVDNASTDGTAEWLRAGSSRDGAGARRRTLASNTGGAGGFHDGLAWALERGADLVWLMDDDGAARRRLPATGCSRTTATSTSGGRSSSTEDDPERLVFPIRLPGGTARRARDGRRRARRPRDGLIRDVVIPFNGVLVTRELVERIGLPRAEFFIWGDDHEYRLRAERAGARIATVVDARVRHPAVGDLGTPMMFGRTTYNDTPERPQALLHGPQQPASTCASTGGWPHAAGVRRQDRCGSTRFTRPRPGAGSG